MEESVGGLFGSWWESIDRDITKAECRIVSHEQARLVIEKYEWLGTYANAPLFAYGIYFEDHLGGVVVYGAPSPPIVARSVAGPENASSVVQLARGACVHWAHPHSASKLIAASLRHAQSLGYRYAIAFSDPDAGEIGTVYQATNWLYCGKTEKRPDYFDQSGKRMVGHFKVDGLTKGKRTRKRRYVFLMGTRAERRKAFRDLRWPVLPYEKRAARPLDAPDPSGVSEVQPLGAAP